MKDSFKMLLLSYGLAIAPLVSLGFVVLPLIRHSPISHVEAYLVGVGLLILASLALVGCDRICGHFCAPQGHRGSFWFIRQDHRFKTFNFSELEGEREHDCGQ